MLVHRAAGDCLRKASLDGRTRAFVAEPFPVQIPQDSPLRAEGGVRTVIQVLGPNLDPRFPECLHDKPEEARRLLRVSYDRALECFWDLTTRSVPLGAGAAFTVAGSTLTDETIPRGVKWPVEDPVTVGGRAAGGDVSAESGAIKRAGDESSATGAATRPRSSPDSFPAYRRDKALPASSGKGGGSWKNALYHYLRQPRSPSLQAGVFYEDECCVVVYDGYPKSRFHLLLLAKKEASDVLDVKTPSALRTEHLPVLRRLHAVGEAVAQALKQQGAGAVRCGYHSIPSLDPLHLHIISQDFDAPRLKRKSHWNSFTTGLTNRSHLGFYTFWGRIFMTSVTWIGVFSCHFHRARCVCWQHFFFVHPRELFYDRSKWQHRITVRYDCTPLISATRAEPPPF
ncbi:unnamed protein product, partial [Ascophyllum nodosum]